MSYPSPTLWGAGAPLFILNPNHPGGGPRELRTTSGPEMIIMPSLALESPEPTFSPVRRDGGDVVVMLDNGESIDRLDGYRLQATFVWKNLTLAQAQRVAQICSWRIRGSVEVQLRADCSLRFRVICSEPEISHPNGLYTTHIAKFSVVGVDILPEIPILTTDLSPAYYPLEF